MNRFWQFFGMIALAALAAGAAMAQDVASTLANNGQLTMPLGTFLDYCNAGNQATCIAKLGDTEALVLDFAWAHGGPICWPQDSRGAPDAQRIGQQVFDWLNSQTARRSDQTEAVEAGAAAALYPCSK